MNLTSKVFQKLFRETVNDRIEYKQMLQAGEMLELKRQLRNHSDSKIRVVFVCHRPQIWGALKTVFEACVADDDFEPIIVTIPNKKEIKGKDLNHEIYVSEGAEEYYKDYPCQVIQGFNYDTKKWFDLRELSPDYLFFQNPYDICRPPAYKSDVVCLYTKICYVHYGMPFMGSFIAEESFPINFLKHTYFHFAEFKEMKDYYINRVEENPVHSHARVILSGYPKLDGIEQYQGCDNDTWKYHGDDKRFRVMWTPRWSTSEGNCTFFDHKDLLTDYIAKDDKAELLFRPHPQMFSEFLAKKEMTKKEIHDYKEVFKSHDNLSVDKEKNYLPSFYSSDVLITDESSIIPEYFLTGKPVIFTYKETHLNDFAKNIAEGFYWAKDFDEVKKFLRMLESGEDPKAEQRLELIRNSYYLPEKGAGYEIKELIKADFNK